MTTTSQGTRFAGAVTAIAFAAVAYLSFLAVSVYAVAFLADVGVPRGIDHGGPGASTASAVFIDALLLTAFALHHSVMARPMVKAAWTRLVPKHLERSCYVLLASALQALVFWQWRPVPHIVWDVHAPAGRVALWLIFGFGWALVVAMTFAIDHFDLTGVRQVEGHVRNRARPAPQFRLPLPYRLVRHPMMTGFFIAFLATPHMTVGHLLFALLSCGYIVVAVHFEERDLARELPGYREYAAQTPRYFPSPTAVGRPGERRG